MSLKANNMRVSGEDLRAMKILFRKHFLREDGLWLFGSRLDMTKKGGDIDLYIETYADSIDAALRMKSAFIFELEEKIGEQKIDVVLNIIKYPYPLAIHEIALKEGRKIV